MPSDRDFGQFPAATHDPMREPPHIQLDKASLDRLTASGGDDVLANHVHLTLVKASSISVHMAVAVLRGDSMSQTHVERLASHLLTAVHANGLHLPSEAPEIASPHSMKLN